MRALNQTHLKGLANAVLRKVARDGAALLAPAIRPSQHAALAVGRLEPKPTARTPRGPSPPISSRRRSISRYRRRRLLGRTLEADVLPTGTLRRPAAAHRRPAGVRRGTWWVAGCRRHPAVRLLGDIKGKARRPSCARHRAGKLCSSVAARPRSPPSTSRTAGWPVGENLKRAGSRRAGDGRCRQMDACGKVRCHPARRTLLRHRHAARHPTSPG